MAKHPHKALTDAKAKSIKIAGLYADGGGLYLKVDKSGAKRWLHRIQYNGKRHDLGLGSFRKVSLSNARTKAQDNLRLIGSGGDPLKESRKAKAIMTFKDSAQTVYESKLPDFSNPKHAKQWIKTLETYAFPFIGNKKVSNISSSDILAVLSPIWTAKPETASRVKQRISAVLKWAIAKEWRTDDPTDAIASALPKNKAKATKHRSLPFNEVTNAINTINASGASLSVKLGLEFLILTAARSGEVRGAKWGEIDIDKQLWTIPAERMKQRQEHRVPLSPRCIEILAMAQGIKTDSGYIFPAAYKGKPLSDSTLSKLIRENKIDCVPHGFRSSFRIWSAEQTNIPREVCEFALAHVVGDKAEQAYQRSDLFDKRRKLMDMWASYLSVRKGEIVSINEASL